MLQLNNIVKTYAVGDNAVAALRGISLQFRHSEFVSVLGPSGCGKTTLLNLVGGLDRYTSGDLIINGKSTKSFRDRDWDTYRNHTIGFVFQSYNLIPHQSVLQNVEMALTLSGVSRQERRRRAIEALERVGLTSQLRKKPTQMSGGQMQRVAIARALVNNPDIILADEPTGALDTETSVQVMEILKEVARDRLVVMVTHNPDLAERYSTRIIRMLDGQITDDSAPLTEEEIARETELETAKREAERKKKKPSMKFHTAFGLSLKNLFTKKGRTALTGFAGSIGIIGIALIYAVSQGTTNYIDMVQEETLASYPLTLEATHVDVGSLLETFMGAAESDHSHENDAVYQKSAMYDMINALNTVEEDRNDLKSFREFLEAARNDENDTTGLRESVSGVQCTYDMDLLVYTKGVDGEILHSDTQALLTDLIAEYMGAAMASNATGNGNGNGGGVSLMGGSGSMGSAFASRSGLWQEMLSGDDGAIISPILEKQYDVIWGRWPEKAEEIVLVLDDNNELTDMALYALGLKSKDDIDKVMKAAMNKETIDIPDHSWSYDEIGKREFRVILSSDCYSKDEKTGLFSDLRETDAGLQYLYDNGLKLKVTGIIRPDPDCVSAMLTGSIGYTGLLTDEVMKRMNASEAVNAQRDDPETDVLTGLKFRPDDDDWSNADKLKAFRERVKEMTDAEKAEAFIAVKSVPPTEQLKATVDQMMAGMDRPRMEATMIQSLAQQMSVGQEQIQKYIAAMSDEELTEQFRKAIEKQVSAQYAAQVEAQLAMMSVAQRAAGMDAALDSLTEEQGAQFYDEILKFSETTYEDNLRLLGNVDPDSPSTINLYAATFAAKDTIKEAITDYNDTVEELSRINYTDYVGIIMSSVTTIIDAITYVLIAFVAISLIVSSIMIGVITLISVQERTKEIGILRALGASKRDVSSMFNAETVIIGLLAGLLGIGITYLLCFPINAIIHSLTGIYTLSATLPWQVAAVLVGVSVLLTLFAGIIPSRSAARKDPVVALRTE